MPEDPDLQFQSTDWAFFITVILVAVWAVVSAAKDFPLVVSLGGIALLFIALAIVCVIVNKYYARTK